MKPDPLLKGPISMKMKIAIKLIRAKIAHPRSAVEYVEFENGILVKKVTFRDLVKF